MYENPRERRGGRKDGETLIYRNRQARWDKAHMRTCTTKMTRAEYETFRRQCAATGTTPYGLLLRLIRQWQHSLLPPDLSAGHAGASEHSAATVPGIDGFGVAIDRR